MKNLQMPHSYISVSEEELRSISGGGPLGDALDLFFSNLRLDDLFFSGKKRKSRLSPLPARNRFSELSKQYKA